MTSLPDMFSGGDIFSSGSPRHVNNNSDVPPDDSENKDDGVSRLSNAELVPNAGKVEFDKALSWGTGIVHDFKTTVGTHWFSEVSNFNQKTVAVSLVMFISVMAPTLSFGAVYGKETDNRIGAFETILATSWVGVIYSMIGGMPLCIIGSTGPILAFTTAVASIAENLDVPFLTLNVWISAWMLFYCLLGAFFDVARLLRVATRFFDDIFALLIVSIFVLGGVGDPFSQVGILRYFNPNHNSHGEYDNDPDYDYMEVALLSTLLGFGTTALIFFFRGFKTSVFFCNQGFRTSVHDLAVTVSVLLMTFVKEFLFPGINTESLNVPDKFEPTFQCCDSSCQTFWPDDCPTQAAASRSRPWFTDFSNLNGKKYVPILAALPAIGAFVLCFLDCGKTWHLVMHKSHKLQHGKAYNYDLCLVGVFNFVNACLGLPWLVASSVPCIVHLHALAEKDRFGKIIYVQETRLTMFFSHLLVGLSLLFLKLLQFLPMCVLYGVFVFMGLAALPGIQCWNRFLLMLQQPSLYPDFVFVRYMEKKRIHLFTLVEIFFFGLVFVVQHITLISILFPFMILLLIPARLYWLPDMFEGWELLLLDGDDTEIEEWEAKKRDQMHFVLFAKIEDTELGKIEEDEDDDEE